MERNNIDLVLAGVDPLDGEALELLTYVRRKHREVPVILLFPRLHPERAKEALRLGAMAVLKYPVPAAELRAAVLASPRAVARPGRPKPAGSRCADRPARRPARQCLRPLPQATSELGAGRRASRRDRSSSPISSLAVPQLRLRDRCAAPASVLSRTASISSLGRSA